MDQTNFSLGLGLLLGFPVGAVLIHTMTGWSRIAAWPLGGVLGLLCIGLATYVMLELLGRLQEHSGHTGDDI